MKTILILLSFLLLTTFGFAQDISLIDSNKILTEEEQVLVKEAIDNKIFKELMPAKNDYVNRYDRGTVEFNPNKGVNMLGREVFSASNYSHHKVIVPDGTYLKGINFTQKEPHTVALINEQGTIAKNLTFEDCNLTNVETDPSWNYVGGCGATYVRRILKSQEDLGDGTYRMIVSFQTEKNNKFVEVSEDEEIIPVDELSDFLSSLNIE